MRKEGGDLYGRQLEKKVMSAIRELFAEGHSKISIADVKTQLEFTGTTDPELIRRVRYTIHNLAQENEIEIKKLPGHREMPTIFIVKCLDK